MASNFANTPKAHAVAVAHKSYAAARPKSEAQAIQAAKVLPAGSTRSVLDFDPFPFRVAHASGAQLYDVDGHQYVDMLGDYTAGLLGHNPPIVANAVRAVLDRGWSLGALASDEHRLAELITGRFPSLEQVRFTNSGTEANLMAINLARHLTGRDSVMVFNGAYHGGLLYFGDAGQPLRAPFSFIMADYNDLESVRHAFEQAGGKIGCVLVEPMMGAAGCIVAKPGFLAGLRQLCDEHGAKLIFDEVMTSRMSAGGAQLKLGVIPDLTTLGKYLGGGMTFGAFGGCADDMAAFDPKRGGILTHGGTFNNNAMTMTAGVAAIQEMLAPSVLDDLFDQGEQLRMRISEVVRGRGMTVSGWGSLMNIHCVDADVSSPRDAARADQLAAELLFHGLLKRGYYMARRGFVAVSLALTTQDVDGFVDALMDVVDEMKTNNLLPNVAKD